MTTQYKAIEGERLDQIVYAYYGSLELFETVLESNLHLLNVMHLRAGDIVNLNEITIEKSSTYSEENLKSLW